MRVCLPSKLIDHYDWISILESYRRYVTPGSIVLEIGASNLEKTRELSRFCRELIGVELVPERTPSNFENVRYVTGDWQELSSFLRPESIDLAISSHVIEHVPDDLRAINELYSVLRPGGRAILNTPNRKRLVRTFIEGLWGEKTFPCGEHVREYLEQDLIRLVTASSFRRYDIRPIVFGIHGGPFYAYTTSVPRQFRGLANFWQVHLFKD